MTEDQLNQLEANAHRRAGTWEADEVLEAVAAERLRRAKLSGSDDAASEEDAAGVTEEVLEGPGAGELAEALVGDGTPTGSTAAELERAAVPEVIQPAPPEATQCCALQPGTLKRHKQFKGATLEVLEAEIQRFEALAPGWTKGRNLHAPRITRRGLVVTRLYSVSTPESGLLGSATRRPESRWARNQS